MADDDPIEILERAVTRARERGFEVSGWMLQSGPAAYVAWLYVEDDDGSWPIFDEVDTCASALQAAQWVADQVEELEPD